MSLSFADSVGSLFNRLGSIGGIIANMRSNQAAQLTAITDTTTGVVAQYNSESDLQSVMGSSYISLVNNIGSIGSTCSNLAAKTVNRMVFRDNPRAGQTLTNGNLTECLKEVIRQMQLASASVLSQTVGATPGSFTGEGNGVVNVSVKRPLDGKTLQNAYGETVLLTCTTDSYTGGARAGNERITVTGAGRVSQYAFNWPGGSGGNIQISAIDGNSNNTRGNILTNSGFSSFTGNTPDNFTVVTGTAGTHFSKESSITYDGSFALKITGDGSNATELRQTFGVSTGTRGELDPQTQYSLCVFLRRDGTAADDGELTISLTDGDDNTIQDEAGVENTFTIDLTSLTTTYTAYKTVFRTPAILPSTVKIKWKLTTPLTDQRSVYVDKMSLGVMTQLYRSGPYFAVHSGSNPFLSGDFATVAVTNSRGSGGTLNTWQTLLQTLFLNEIMSNELLFPSSGTPTISDGLIG